MAYQTPVQDGTQPQQRPPAWNTVLQGIAAPKPTAVPPPGNGTLRPTIGANGAPIPGAAGTSVTPNNFHPTFQPPMSTPDPYNPGGPTMSAPDPYNAGPKGVTQRPGQLPPGSVGGTMNNPTWNGKPLGAPLNLGGPSTAPLHPYNGGNPVNPEAPQTPAAPPATPAVPPGTPVNAAGTPTGAETSLPTTPLSAYGPGQNLIGSQINPGAQPNRLDIANQYFNEAQQATNPAYEATLRDATQRAAATGSLGSGMLNTSYGNLALQRAQNLDQLQRELQTQATEGTIGDQRFNTGVTQQQQAYQAAMAQQALQNRIQQLGTEQNIGAGQAGYLANYNPWPGITGSNIYGNQAQNGQSQLQQLFQASGLGGALNNVNWGAIFNNGTTQPNWGNIIPTTGSTTDPGSYDPTGGVPIWGG